MGVFAAIGYCPGPCLQYADLETKLTLEQEALIDEQMAADGSFAFSADDIAEDLGIPPLSERDWTDEEIDRVWAESRGATPTGVHCSSSYILMREPSRALALLK